MKYRILPRELEITGFNKWLLPLSFPNWAIALAVQIFQQIKWIKLEKKQADLVVPVKVTNRAKGLACNVVATIFGFM